MATKAEKSRVYLACRPIFSDSDALLRKAKKVKELVNKNKIPLQPLLKDLGEVKLLETVRYLLERRIFESELRAKVEFPELFLPSPSRDAQRQASELGAARSTAEALNEIISRNGDGDVPEQEIISRNGIVPQLEIIRQNGSSAVPKEEITSPNGNGAVPQEIISRNGSSAVQQEEIISPNGISDVPQEAGISGEEVDLVTQESRELSREGQGVTPPTEKRRLADNVPSLYPSYLPYQTQHAILTKSQQVLEECCFDFAKEFMPSILQEKGWDCPAAIELTVWMKMLRQEEVRALLRTDDHRAGLGDTIRNVSIIRHTAVHRLPTTAHGISVLLEAAVGLAQLLWDDLRAVQLGELRSELDSKIRAMELNKNVLEDTLSAGLRDIQQQREELDRREAALIEGMVKDDLENKAFIGHLLEERTLVILRRAAGEWIADEVKGGAENGQGSDKIVYESDSEYHVAEGKGGVGEDGKDPEDGHDELDTMAASPIWPRDSGRVKAVYRHGFRDVTGTGCSPS